MWRGMKVKGDLFGRMKALVEWERIREDNGGLL